MTGDTDIVRVRGYAVRPDPGHVMRFTGQDTPGNVAFELLRVTLRDGSEGVAGSATGWFGADQGVLCTAFEGIGEALLGSDAAARDALVERIRPDDRIWPLLMTRAPASGSRAPR